MTLPSQEFFTIYRPNVRPSTPTPLAIFVHGYTALCGDTRVDTIGSGAKLALCEAVVNAGYTMASSNAHGNGWGNALSVADYVELYAYLRTTFNISRTVLIGQSMGGLPSLTLIAEKGIPVKGWAGIYPCCNLAQNYAGDFQASIKTAYGIAGDGSDYDTKTAGHDPVLQDADNYNGVRMRFYASAADTVVPKADHTDTMVTLVTGHATECGVVACSGTHGDASHFQSADLISFLNRCV